MQSIKVYSDYPRAAGPKSGQNIHVLQGQHKAKNQIVGRLAPLKADLYSLLELQNRGKAQKGIISHCFRQRDFSLIANLVYLQFSLCISFLGLEQQCCNTYSKLSSRQVCLDLFLIWKPPSTPGFQALSYVFLGALFTSASCYLADLFICIQLTLSTSTTVESINVCSVSKGKSGMFCDIPLSVPTL